MLSNLFQNKKLAVCGVGNDFVKFLQENAGERSPDAQVKMTDFSAVDSFNLVLSDGTELVYKHVEGPCQFHSVDKV